MVFLARIFVLMAPFLGVAGPAQPLERASARATEVRGSVVLSPASPVCRTGQPCTKPLAGFRLIISVHRKPVARARTDRRGRYETVLPPGTYTVATTTPSRAGRGLAPHVIQVPAAARVIRDFTFDAGIR